MNQRESAVSWRRTFMTFTVFKVNMCEVVFGVDTQHQVWIDGAETHWCLNDCFLQLRHKPYSNTSSLQQDLTRETDSPKTNP